jgi:hypothetical protein
MHDGSIANGPIENWLAIIGVISLIYWGWRIVAAFQRRGQDKEPARAVSTPAVAMPGQAAAAVAAETAPENDIVVIAAAVHAIMGEHRIVHLEPEDQGQGWAVEGRWMQQTSHKIRP